MWSKTWPPTLFASHLLKEKHLFLKDFGNETTLGEGEGRRGIITFSCDAFLFMTQLCILGQEVMSHILLSEGAQVWASCAFCCLKDQ